MYSSGGAPAGKDKTPRAVRAQSVMFGLLALIPAGIAIALTW